MTDLVIRGCRGDAGLAGHGFAIRSWKRAEVSRRGLELRVGLAIGRIVFRALTSRGRLGGGDRPVCLTIAGPSGPVLVLAAVTAVLLAVQLLLVRPRLNRRSARVLAGHVAPRSRAHRAYIGLGGAQARRSCRPWRRPPVGMRIPGSDKSKEKSHDR